MATEDAARSPLKLKPLNHPGQSLDRRMMDLVFDKLLGYWLVALVCWVLLAHAAIYSWVGRVPDPLPYLGVAVLATAIGAAFGRRVWIELHHVKQGRDGERIVGQALQSFDLPGLRVYHDLPAQGFNLDHVLVCDRGIYVVETKTWSKRRQEKLRTRRGRILLGKRPVYGDPVGQAAGEARWLSEMLAGETGTKFRCQPVVVAPGWWVEPMDTETKAIAWVLEPKALRGWIEKDRPVLSASEIARIDHAISGYVRRALEV